MTASVSAEIDTVSEMRAACKIRLSMSRPVSSVPNEYAADGQLNRSGLCNSNGLYGAITGAASADNAITPRRHAAKVAGAERPIRRSRLRAGEIDEPIRRLAITSGAAAIRTRALTDTGSSPAQS